MDLLTHKVGASALFAIAVTLIILGFLTASNAEIYGYQDSDGRWHFPHVRGKVAGSDKKGRCGTRKDYYLASYMPLIHSASQKYGVEEALIKAVVMAESGYDWTAMSRKGAVGLMQLMPKTARSLKVGNPFSPKANIEGGVRYLKYLLKRFDNDMVLAVAAYNAGPARVESAGSIPPVPETKRFVQRVLYLYHQFKYGQRDLRGQGKF